VTTTDVPECAIRHVGASITRPRALAQGKLGRKRVGDGSRPRVLGPQPAISDVFQP
jgi:hypothetical protein